MGNSRFFVEDVFSIEGIGLVLAGKLTVGSVKVGDSIKLGGNLVEIKNVESFKKKTEELQSGDKGGLNIGVMEKDEARVFVGQEVAIENK